MKAKKIYKIDFTFKSNENFEYYGIRSISKDLSRVIANKRIKEEILFEIVKIAIRIEVMKFEGAKTKKN